MNKFSPLKSKKIKERSLATYCNPDHWILLSLNFVYYIVLFPSNFLTDMKNIEYKYERFIIMGLGLAFTLIYFLLILIKDGGKYLRLISLGSVIWSTFFLAQLPRYIEIQNDTLMGLTTILSLLMQITLINIYEMGPLVFTLVNIIIFLKAFKGGITPILFTHNVILAFLLYIICKRRNK
jgi:hypothetical protein